MENLKQKNSKLCANVARLAVEHAEMAQYIEDALPFLKKENGCSVYQDGQIILKKVNDQ